MKNTVKNVETDPSGYIPTDHYPIIAEIQIKLKAQKKQSTLTRVKFNEAGIPHRLRYNNDITEHLKKFENDGPLTYNQFIGVLGEAAYKHIPIIKKRKNQKHQTG